MGKKKPYKISKNVHLAYAKQKTTQIIIVQLRYFELLSQQLIAFR